jgi:membrane protein DedA with SNARE-associated domain
LHTEIETAVLAAAQSIYEIWGWLGVAALLTFENATGITPSEIILGLAHMPFVAFFLATFTGSYVWCTLLIGAGYLLGHEWTLISAYLKQYLPFLLAGGGAALGLYLWVTWRRFAFVSIRRDNEE